MYKTIGAEAATGGVVQKKLFLKILKYSQEVTCAESFFNKVAGLGPASLLKRDLTQVLSCEYFEIFKNIYFEEYLRTAVSIRAMLKLYRGAVRT